MGNEDGYQAAMEAKSAAERAAREAEEARRAVIQAQIDELDMELEQCRNLMDDFSSEKSMMNSLVAEMIISILDAMPSGLSFKGITAQALYKSSSKAEQSHKKNVAAINEVVSALEDQIGILSSYIMELRERIDGLRNSL